METSRVTDVKPRISDTIDKIKCWKFPEIADSTQLKTLKLPDPLTASKVRTADGFFFVVVDLFLCVYRLSSISPKPVEYE